MASAYRLQERIAAMMFGGASLDRVEHDVIEPCDLSADQKAALWLYAWSFVDVHEQGIQATGYLTNLERLAGSGPRHHSGESRDP